MTNDPTSAAYEAILEDWLDNAMSTSLMSVGIDGYHGETDPVKIEELRKFDYDFYKSKAVEALASLHEQAIAEAETRGREQSNKMWKREHDHWKNLAEQLMRQRQLGTDPKIIIEANPKSQIFIDSLQANADAANGRGGEDV